MDQSDAETSGKTTKGISRRTLVAGTAWAVPVVAVASAAPAFAQSPCSLNVTFITNSACKWPGNSCSSHPKGYSFCFNVTDTCPCDVKLHCASIPVVTKTGGGTTPVLECFADQTIAAGTGSFCLFFPSSNSANQTFDVAFDFTFTTLDCSEPQYSGGGAGTASVTGTPPDCTCV